MIDLLAEIYDLNTWTSLYAWIYFGIAIKLLIDLSGSFSFSDHEKPAGMACIGLSLSSSDKPPRSSNFVLIWIGKCIKKKCGLNDDSDEPSPLLKIS